MLTSSYTVCRRLPKWRVMVLQNAKTPIRLRPTLCEKTIQQNLTLTAAHRLYLATMRLQSGQVRRPLISATPAVDAPFLISSSEMFCLQAEAKPCSSTRCYTGMAAQLLFLSCVLPGHTHSRYSMCVAGTTNPSPALCAGSAAAHNSPAAQQADLQGGQALAVASLNVSARLDQLSRNLCRGVLVVTADGWNKAIDQG